MPRVLFVQNGEYDHAALFAKVLAENDVNLDVVHAWRGEPVPTVPNGWSGIVIGGGSMSAYEGDVYPFLLDETQLIHAARKKGTPVLGMCLGAQLMAAALGGKVYPNSEKEIGFYDIRFTPEAESDPLWKGETDVLQPVHWHGDVFSLPPEAVRLASSDLTPNQAFRVGGNLYGFQFHLEIDEPALVEMIETDDGSLSKNGVDPQRFLNEAKAILPKVEPVARTVFNRWISLIP